MECSDDLDCLVPAGGVQDGGQVFCAWLVEGDLCVGFKSTRWESNGGRVNEQGSPFWADLFTFLLGPVEPDSLA